MKKIGLIGYQCGWGAKDSRCAAGPKFLKEYGLAKDISNENISAVWQELIYSKLENKKLDDKAVIVSDYCKILDGQIKEAVQKGLFPVSIGGDHSMAVGTWGAIAEIYRAEQNLGLVWVDAHMDAHTNKTSHSGAYHGMPISCLLGEKNKINGGKKILNPKHLCMIGIRSYEKEEKALLDKLGVNIFYIDEVKKEGFDRILKKAISLVSIGTKNIGLSIDLDAFDPQDAPGTGCLEKNGIKSEEAIKAFSGIVDNQKLVAVEIAEYNPSLDKKNITAKLVRDLLVSIFEQS